MQAGAGTARAWPLAIMGAVIALALGLAACSERSLLEKIAPPDDQAMGARVVADLQRGPAADADLLPLMQPVLRERMAAALPQLRGITPQGADAKSELVDVRTGTVAAFDGGATRQTYLGFDASAGGKHALVRLVIARRGALAEVRALVITPLAGPAAGQNALVLTGKSPLQYLVLALAFASFATIVWSEIVLFRTPNIPLRWLWALGCLFGYGQVWIDWSSGAPGFSPLTLQLLGGVAIKTGLLSPWRIGFGVPIVSIAFLLQRRRLQRPVASPAESLAGPEAPG